VVLIELKDVVKEYSRETILNDVNLEIDEGDMYGIIGQSGSGKTTLLNMITGFIPPSKGLVLYHSRATGVAHDLADHLPKIKKQIGFTPQHNSFYPKLTIKENILHFGRLYGLKKETLLSNAKAILQVTHLWEHKDKLAEHLSEGMQRRLDIACSLVHKPTILVLDEPTADLDPVLQKEILALLQDVNKQGVTIVIASHNLESIDTLCNKVAVIHKGKVHTHGTIEEVKKPFFKEHFTITMLPGVNKEQIIHNLQALPIDKIVDQGKHLVIYPRNIEKTVTSLLRLIKEENLYLNDMDMRRPSLNEIFEAITKQP